MFLRKRTYELRFEEHISKKVQAANAILGRSFSYLNCETFKKCTYHLFVRILNMNNPYCAPHLVRNITKLENVQIGTTKLVDGLNNLEYTERLKRLNLPTLVFRRRGDMIEIYKHFHIYDKITISHSFQPRERSSRKHGFQLHLHTPRDGIRGIQSNSFYYRSTKAWNNLPNT